MAGDDRGKQKLQGSVTAGGAAKPRPRKRWIPPPTDVLKINVDGAFSPETGSAALGVIIRDWLGLPVLMAGRILLHCRDVEEAEAMACLEGIRMGARWPEKDVILESDCATVIEKLSLSEIDRSLVAPVIRDALREKSHLKSLRIVKGGREQNKVAHELAHRARCLGESKVWFANFPECFTTLACKDIVD